MRCTFVIEGPNGDPRPGRFRPWWRRQCSRKAVEGFRRCWQHRYPGDEA